MLSADILLFAAPFIVHYSAGDQHVSRHETVRHQFARSTEKNILVPLIIIIWHHESLFLTSVPHKA